MRHSGPRIKLASGAVFDLTGGLEAAFEGKNLTIESDPHRPAIIKLAALSLGDGRTPRPGSLALRGQPDVPASIHLRGIRFEIGGGDEAADCVGLALVDVNQVEIEDCLFLRKDSTMEASALLAVLPRTGTQVNVSGSYFGPGAVGLDLIGSANVAFSQCAFASQRNAVQVLNPLDPEAIGGQSSIRFEGCDLLITKGAAVEVADRMGCKVEAGYSVFSDPSEEGASGVVVRQLGAHTNTAYTPVAPGGIQHANAYHNISPYAEGDAIYSFEECKKRGLDISDEGGAS